MNSTSFVAYGIYDERLAQIVQEKLLSYEDYIEDSLGCIMVESNVVTVIRELFDVDSRGKYYINDYIINEYDERSSSEIASDNKKALTINNICAALNGFFDANFLAQEVVELVSTSLKEGGVKCRLFVDLKDCFDTESFTSEAESLKKRRESYKPEDTKKTKSSKPTTKKEEPSYNKKEFKIKDGILLEYKGNSKDVIIPDVVKTIQYGAFIWCNSTLESVIIPDSVETIGTRAFYECSALKTVTMGQSVKRIESYAFGSCSSLETIIFSPNLEHIGDCAFIGCSSLKTVSIPNSVVEIGNQAFRECSSMCKICIPDAVEQIGELVFAECTALINIETDNNSHFRTIDGNLYSKDGSTIICYAPGKQDSEFKIPEGVLSIADQAFGGIPLCSVQIPASVQYIGKNSFNGCTELTNIEIPSSVTTIDEFAFSKCTSLTNIIIPDSVVTIGIRAFTGCSSLKNVILSNRLSDINSGTFERCTSLVKINIPNAVKRIDAFAFANCSALEEVVFENPYDWTITTTSVDYSTWKVVAKTETINVEDVSNPKTAAQKLVNEWKNPIEHNSVK